MTALDLFMQACIVGMVLSAFLMASRMRLASLASLYAVQSAFLAAAVALYALRRHEAAALVMAVLIISLKVVLIPRFSVRALRAQGVLERLSAFVRPTTLSFAAFAAVLFASIVARPLAVTGASYVALASSVSLVLVGFLMLVSRRDMIGLGFGFLVVENGIFALGLALTGGMPLVVELGVFFDLSVLLILLFALTRRAQREHSSLATEYLSELIG